MRAFVEENLTLHRELVAMTENAMHLKRFRQPGDGRYWSKALNRAIDAAANEETGVFVPNGVHLLDEPGDVLAAAPVRFIMGDGRSSVLEQVELGFPLIRITETDGILLTRVKFVGIPTIDDDSSSQDQGIMVRTLQGTPAIGDNQNVEIVGCYFQDLRYAPFRLQYVRGFRCNRNYIENCSFGPQLWDVKRGNCDGNEINGTSLTDALAVGISLNNSTSTPSEHNEDVTICRNVIRGIHTGQSILVHDGYGVIVGKNVISDALIGISGFPASSATQDMNGVQIVDNEIRCRKTSSTADETGNFGINVSGKNASVPLLNCKISRNTVTGANFCKDQEGQGAIALQGFTEGLICTDNTIDDFKGVGLIIAGENSGLVVTGNNIRNGTTSTAGHNSCIQIRPEAIVTGLCRNNVFDNATDGVRSLGDGSGFVQEDNERYSISNPWAIAGAGLLWQPIVDTGANLTLSRLNRIVFVQTNVGAITVTLPATPWHDMRFLVKDKQGNAAVNNITIARNGKTIDGAAADLVLNIAWSFIELACDGTNWFIVGAYPSRATP